MTGNQFHHNSSRSERDTCRLQHLLQVCTSGILICDRSVIVEASRSMAAILALSGPERLIGRTVAELIDSELREPTMRQLNTLTTNRPSGMASVYSRLKPENSPAIDVQISACLSESGAVRESIYIFRAMNLLCNSPQGGREELNQLTWLHRMAVFGQIAAALMHNLSQPLTAAQGALDVLTDVPSLSNNDARRAYGIARDAVEEAANRYHRVWRYIVAGKPSPAFVNVAEICNEAVQLLQPAAREMAAVIQIQVDPLPELWLDENLIHLVIATILLRAIQEQAQIPGENRRVRTAIRQGSFSRVEVLFEYPVANRNIWREYEQPVVNEGEAVQHDHVALSVCRRIIEENQGILALEPGPEDDWIRIRLMLFR